MTDLTIDNIIEALTKAKEKIAEEREHRHNAIESAIHDFRRCAICQPKVHRRKPAPLPHDESRARGKETE